MKTMSAVPTTQHCRQHAQRGLAPELGLHGIPTRSLVEFEDGGRMLSRGVLGDMLAGNGRGVVDERSHTHGTLTDSARGGVGRDRGQRKAVGSATARIWDQARVIDSGPTEEGKRTRLLCQADALAWWRESARTDLGWPTGCGRMTSAVATGTRRRSGSAENSNGERRCRTPEELSASAMQRAQGQHNHFDGRGVALVQEVASNSTRAIADGAVMAAADPASPTRGNRRSPARAQRSRSRSPVKLYDHDHNPRLLRSLVDDTAVTGLAGGILKAEEEQRIGDLKLQLRLACHRTTELEDQIFQSQTGAPHRELLGELQLEMERKRNIHRPGQWQEKTEMMAKRCDRGPTKKSKVQQRQQQQRQHRPGNAQELFVERPSETKLFRHSDQEFTPTPRDQHGLHGTTPFSRSWDYPLPCPVGKAMTTTTSMFESSTKPQRKNWINNTSAFSLLSTCTHPPSPPSPPLTPTNSLRRYLSSLRPFSADGARATWGLTDAKGQFDGSTWHPVGNGAGCDTDLGRTWPVLFIIGNVKKPAPRHPLGVYSLPLFDDEMILLLAKASGEPVDKIRTMTRILSRLNLSGLQASVESLCFVEHRTTTDDAQRAGGGQRGDGASRLVDRIGRKSTQEAWVRSAAEGTADNSWSESGMVARLSDYRRESLILSDLAASRALRSGFLAGVFADSTIEAIIDVSRPVVVFDSEDTAERKESRSSLAARANSATEGLESGLPYSGPMVVDELGTGTDNATGTKLGIMRWPTGREGANVDKAQKCADVISVAMDVDEGKISNNNNHDRGKCNAAITVPGATTVLKPRPLQHVDGRRCRVNALSDESSGSLGDDRTNTSKKGHGADVLVARLVRAAAARLRVHSVAARLCDADGRSSTSRSLYSSSLRAHELNSGRSIFIGGRRGICRGSGSESVTNMGGSRRRRPASADSDELGLPPLKLRKRGKRQLPRAPWAGEGGDGGGLEAPSASFRGGEHKPEQETDALSSPLRPRSTPRCLRPGFKGEVTTVMLRRELKAAETTAARLGICMARKAEAWTQETRPTNQLSNEAATARTVKGATVLELAGTHARDALVEAAKCQMGKAVELMYVRLIRRSWGVWLELTKRRRSWESAERLTRLVGAAAIGTSVLQPLMRRRTRSWLRRWAAAMRAERVLEVQAAAVELQRTARAFLGRARARGRKRDLAATNIQRIMRGRAGRERATRRNRFLQECGAVMTIEAKYREFVWMRDAVKLKGLKRQERAATKVQAAWRGCVRGRRPARLLREERRLELSALMVQRLWRGVLARVEADALLETKNSKEAAIRIQAAARGRGARKIYGPIILRERAAVRLACFWRCVLARAELGRKHHRTRLALAANPAVRGYLGRLVASRKQEVHQRQQRAVIVACVFAQKLIRGKMGRSNARRMLLRRCAAVELQRIARGRHVRRLASIKEEKIRRQLATWVSAVAIQRLWRGLAGRKKFAQRAAEYARSRAAFTIQSAFRRVRARRLRRLRRLTFAAQNRLPSTLANRLDVKTSATPSGRGDEERDPATTDLGSIVGAPGSSGVAQHAVVRGAAGEQEYAEGNDKRGGCKKRNTLARPGGEAAVDSVGEGESGAENGRGDKKGDMDGKSRARGSSGGEGGIGHDGDVASLNSTNKPAYEDLGDVALAALSQQSALSRETPMPAAPPPPTDNSTLPFVSTSESRPGRGGVEVPPPCEATLAYYEAKLLYLAAQEAAHGASATIIRNMFRAFVARRRASAARALKEDLARSHFRRGQAAVSLQASARGRAARKRAAEMREGLAEVARRERGVITIQCAVRCFVARRRLLHLREEQQAERDRIHRMAVRIQARVRGIQTRDVWTKFFHSRALLERERQRQGAQKIQSTWRSKLARTEAERRKSLKDEALLAEQLERHLQSILQQALEAERRHAHAVRLQCWWRGILAVREKVAVGRELREMPLAEVLQEEQSAALVIQSHWRAAKARRFYYDNYRSLFRERERKKYCTECQGEYATRKCDTCLDKFCENCWVRIHSKGARRFHPWEPFVTFSYDAGLPQQASKEHTATVAEYGGWNDPQRQRQQQQSPNGYDKVTGYYGYFPNWDGQADGYAFSTYDDQEQQQEQQQDYHDYYGHSETSPTSDYNYYNQDWPQQETGKVQGQVSPSSGNWCGDQGRSVPTTTTTSASSGPRDGGHQYAGDYGGAAAYDSGWTGQPDPAYARYYEDNAANEAGVGYWDSNTYNRAHTTTSSSGQPTMMVVADSHYYEGAAAFDHTSKPNDSTDVHHYTAAGANATDWGGWATPDTDNHTNTTTIDNNVGSSYIDGYNDSYNDSPNDSPNDIADAHTSLSEGGGVHLGAGSGGTPGAGGSGGNSGQWSVDEYGQRVSGDWVEYWDHSAQAAYFYNTVTGEASWTEPATG